MRDSERPLGTPPTIERLNLPATPSEAAARGYRAEADAAETLRAYRADLACYRAWCAQEGRAAGIPAAPETVGAYLASLAPRYRLATLRRRLAALARAHRTAGHRLDTGHPAIRETLRGIARRHGAPQRRAAALATAEVRKLVAACRGDLAGLRDRALVLLGYAAALRRSELAAVEHEHLRFTADGLELLLARSKGDQAGEGARVGVPRGQRPETCPVRAMEAWLRASAIRYGPVFCRVTRWGTVEQGRGLSGEGVRLVLLRRAEQAGVEGTHLEPVSPHGLRAGFVTQATKAGLPDEAIMAHTRHKDAKTMRRYVRRARLLDDSPARKLGL
jgi:site-specific recombinase XerD